MMSLYQKLTGGQALRDFWKISPRELLAWVSIKAGDEPKEFPDLEIGEEELI